MPITFKIEGYSDDSVYVEGPMKEGHGDSHDDCAKGRLRRVLIQKDGKGLVACAQHTDWGWLLGVMTYDPELEDLPLPDGWTVRIEPSRQIVYSPCLVIEAPDGAEASWL